MGLPVNIRLETDRLVIRYLEPKDADAYFAGEMASVKEMAPYWSWVNPNKTLEEFMNF